MWTQQQMIIVGDYLLLKYKFSKILFVLSKRFITSNQTKTKKHKEIPFFFGEDSSSSENSISSES
jgi:hypothetical protein